jgi:hypothetical protein
MNRRPLSVTVISWLFVAAGAIGLAYHLTEFKGQFEYGLVWVCIVRFLAIVSGLFMLRGSNWARWLLLVWIVYHVILSAFHSLSELAMHSLPAPEERNLADVAYPLPETLRSVVRRALRRTILS